MPTPVTYTKCHLASLLQCQAKKYGKKEAFRYQDFGSTQWKSINWIEADRLSHQVSRAMLALEVGVQENIGVFASNSLEFAMVDFAAWRIRATSVPVYPKSSAGQLLSILNETEIRILFVGGQYQYDMATEAFKDCAFLKKIVFFDPNVDMMEGTDDVLSWKEFLALGADDNLETVLNKRQEQACDDDLMSIVYTSGTMGECKGVMLTHGQARAAISVNDNLLPFSTDDVAFHLLPYSHIYGKGWLQLCVAEGCPIVILANPQEAVQAIRETHPTCMCSVPRFWEKVCVAIKANIENAGAAKKALIKFALKIGRKHNVDYPSQGKRPPLSLALVYKTVDAMVFAAIRKGIGFTNPHFFPTGGATVSSEVEILMRSIGIPLMPGYGLTEGYATVSNYYIGTSFTVGSVGRPMPGLSVKIAPDGEIMLKGPTIAKGYYKRPDLTAQAFDEEGYYHTGDLGYLKDGELFLTERKHDYYKLSTGKFVAPQLVESKLIVDPLIDQVMVIADRRKFTSALIVPDFNILADYCSKNGIVAGDRQTMCKNPEVMALYTSRLETLQQSLAPHERIKRFALLPEAFDIDSGELTNTLKMKRKVISEHYKEIIDALY